MQRRTPAEPGQAHARTQPGGGDGRTWRAYLNRGPWFTVGVLTAANAFAFLDRQVLGLLIEPIRTDLGLTDTQISILIGFAFAIFYSVFGIPIGRLVDARSRRVIIAAGITVWSLATAACGLTRSFWTLFLGRIGVGAGEATLGPAAMSMISDLFPPERRGTAIAVFITGSAIGAGFATVFAATVFAVLEDFEQIDLPLVGAMRPWQIVFFVVGLPGLLVGCSLRHWSAWGSGRSPSHSSPTTSSATRQTCVTRSRWCRWSRSRWRWGSCSSRGAGSGSCRRCIDVWPAERRYTHRPRASALRSNHADI